MEIQIEPFIDMAVISYKAQFKNACSHVTSHDPVSWESILYQLLIQLAYNSLSR